MRVLNRCASEYKFDDNDGNGCKWCGYLMLYSPATTYGEYNVIGMMFRFTFHELYARRILPVTHGLFEKGLMKATKIAIDFVWNHTKVPDTFLLSGNCTRSTAMFAYVTGISERKTEKSSQKNSLLKDMQTHSLLFSSPACSVSASYISS